MPAHAAAPPFSSASVAGLVDTEGRAVVDSNFRGRYRLVLFGFTSCADICPLTLLAVKQSLALMGKSAAQVVPLFISVDPDRDRGDNLARYLHAFDDRILGLTGPQAALNKVAAGHGIFFEKRWVDVSNNVYVFDHTASILLISPEGKLLASISTVGTPDDVARRIVAALPQIPR